MRREPNAPRELDVAKKPRLPRDREDVRREQNATRELEVAEKPRLLRDREEYSEGRYCSETEKM